MSALIPLVVLLVLAPLLPAVATRMVALLTGRRGAPLSQPYRDLGRLFRKGVVYGTVTTWIFRAAPLIWVLTGIAAASLVPLAGRPALWHFPGDFILFAGFLAFGRFFLTLSALDTGSSFEGMGASRELMIGSFAEPVLFLAFATLAVATGGRSLSELFGPALWAVGTNFHAAVVMVALSLALLLLAEAARGPIDDPATHLELTMIHEVMILDHSGPDLALFLFGSALRFALFSALLVDLAQPGARLAGPAGIAALCLGVVAVAALVGILESSMARLRLIRVPQYLASALVLAALGALITLR